MRANARRRSETWKQDVEVNRVEPIKCASQMGSFSRGDRAQLKDLPDPTTVGLKAASESASVLVSSSDPLV